MLPVRLHDRIAAVICSAQAGWGQVLHAGEEGPVDLAVSLGPHVENAKLLENLENEVEMRTQNLNVALVEAMLKKGR
jgi:hypothetical protein